MSTFKPYVEFKNGCRMPIIGIGTWIGSPEEIRNSVHLGLEIGYRHIDTAYAYGSEKLIGEELKKWLLSGRLHREDLFVTTKLPPNGMRKEDVRRFLTKSLIHLHLDYVDLYLMQMPVGIQNVQDDLIYPKDEVDNILLDMRTNLLEVWRGMEEMVELGLAKSIGLANVNAKQIQRIQEHARIKISNVQLEYHIYCQQKAVADFCKSRGITMCAFGPLGFMETLPEEKEIDLSKNHLIIRTERDSVTDSPILGLIAAKYGKHPSQVMLRWMAQKGIAAIPRSRRLNELARHYQIFDFELTSDEMRQLDAQDRSERQLTNIVFFPGAESHPEFPTI